jgi:hypothetical protein
MPPRYDLEDLALDEARRRFEPARERAGGLLALSAERVALANALDSAAYRQAVASMGGYDVERMGEEM